MEEVCAKDSEQEREEVSAGEQSQESDEVSIGDQLKKIRSKVESELPARQVEVLVECKVELESISQRRYFDGESYVKLGKLAKYIPGLDMSISPSKEHLAAVLQNRGLYAHWRGRQFAATLLTADAGFAELCHQNISKAKVKQELVQLTYWNAAQVPEVRASCLKSNTDVMNEEFNPGSEVSHMITRSHEHLIRPEWLTNGAIVFHHAVNHEVRGTGKETMHQGAAAKPKAVPGIVTDNSGMMVLVWFPGKDEERVHVKTLSQFNERGGTEVIPEATEMDHHGGTTSSQEETQDTRMDTVQDEEGGD
jgi:hypothetical protein